MSLRHYTMEIHEPSNRILIVDQGVVMSQSRVYRKGHVLGEDSLVNYKRSRMRGYQVRRCMLTLD